MSNEKQIVEVANLIKKVESVVKQNKELSILKGENYNVFQIFDMERDENKMHSRFINTLINPNGYHGRGAIFLELFLKALNISDYFDNLESVNTKVEHSIGKVKINDVNSTGGRIDIYLWDGKKSISIENKIHANDQEKQIERYCNYKKNTNTVFYLSLYGKEPEGLSKGKLKSNLSEDVDIPDFYCISYSENILFWLEECQKEASDFPIIRETIKQYVISIKRLTGQLINNKMNNEIKKLIVKNYESARIISDNITNVKINVIEEFLNELTKNIQNELKDECWYTERKNKISEKYCQVMLKNKKWDKNIKIAFEASPYYWKHETILGFPIPKNNKVIDASIIESFKKEFSKSSKNWHFFKTFFNLSNESQFSKLLSKASRKSFIDEKTVEVVELAQAIDKHIPKK